MRRASMERLAWARRHLRDLSQDPISCYPGGYSGHQLALLLARGLATSEEIPFDQQPRMNLGREPTPQERRREDANRRAHPFHLYTITAAGLELVQKEPDTWR